MEQIFSKRTSQAGDFNGLAHAAAPKTARIKPGSPADIKSVRDQLLVWLIAQPSAVRPAGLALNAGLESAALAKGEVHPAIRAELKARVAELDRTRRAAGG